MVGPTELESVTSCVSSRRSNQLSYGPKEFEPLVKPGSLILQQFNMDLNPEIHGSEANGPIRPIQVTNRPFSWILSEPGIRQRSRFTETPRLASYLHISL